MADAEKQALVEQFGIMEQAHKPLKYRTKNATADSQRLQVTCLTRRCGSIALLSLGRLT
jgi:hypothetical protein